MTLRVAFAATAVLTGWMWGTGVARGDDGKPAPAPADDAADTAGTGRKRVEVEGPPAMTPSAGSPATSEPPRPPVSPPVQNGNDTPAGGDAAPVAAVPAEPKAIPAVPEAPVATPAVPTDAVPSARRSTEPEASSLPADQGVLEIETEPAGALVTIGYSPRAIDQEVGETPLALQLPATKYYVSITKEGFETATAEVDVVAGETRPLRVRLQPAAADRRRVVRIAGNAVFWPGVVVVGTGIGLIVAESKNREELKTGTAGIVLVGVGLAQLLAGGLMLGLTYRAKGVYTMPQSVSVAPSGRGDGAQVSYTRFF